MIASRRSPFLAAGPLAFAFSAALHGGLFLAWRSGAPSARGGPVSESVEVLVDNEPAPRAPESAALLPPTDRVTDRPSEVLSHVAPALAKAPPSRLDAPAAAAVPAATSDNLPRFTIAIGVATDDASGAVAPVPKGAPGDAERDDLAPLPEETVDTQARLVRGIAPSYPDAARAGGVEGDIRLELVVGVAGNVESARVLRGVGHGLDDSALRAARQFQFAPATKAGHTVRVRMGWSIQFRLQ